MNGRGPRRSRGKDGAKRRVSDPSVLPERSVALNNNPGSGFKRIVKIFPEGRNQGLTKEFIYADALPATLLEGAAADIPAVEIEGAGAVAESRYADGIESARDGLDKAAAAVAVRSFDSAEAVAILEAGIGALLAAPQQGRHHIAIDIYLEKAGLGYALAPFGRHIILIIVILLLQAGGLLFEERGAAVADYAAGSLTDRIVATEKLCHDFGGDKDVAYLDYCGPGVRHIFCKIKQ